MVYVLCSSRVAISVEFSAELSVQVPVSVAGFL